MRDADEHHSLEPMEITIRGVKRNGYNNELREWWWSPALQMWRFSSGVSGVMATADFKKGVGKDPKEGEVVYVVFVQPRGKAQIRLKKYYPSFHAAAMDVVGQDDIAFHTDLEGIDIAAPIEQKINSEPFVL